VVTKKKSSEAERSSSIERVVENWVEFWRWQAKVIQKK
jgi:hypothetical protein